MDIKAIINNIVTNWTIPDSYKGYQGWPVPNYPTVVSKQEFGVESVTGHPHRGRDLSVSEGTPVYAANDGTVTLTWTSGYNVPPSGDDGSPGGYGNQVRIDNGSGLETRYGHLSKVNVSPQESVSQGELIGYSGNTGKSTGPHLHFEDVYQGNPVDPVPLLGGDSPDHPNPQWTVIWTKLKEDIVALVHDLPDSPTRDQVKPIVLRLAQGVEDLRNANAPEAVIAILTNIAKMLNTATAAQLSDKAWWEKFLQAFQDVSIPDIPNPKDWIKDNIIDNLPQLVLPIAGAFVGIFLVAVGVWGLIGNAPGGQTIEGLAQTAATGGGSRVARAAKTATRRREKTPGLDWLNRRMKEMEKEKAK